MLVDDGRMIACAGLLVADVEVAGVTFPVVGVGGVIVTHTRRGEGLARTRDGGRARARGDTSAPTCALLFCRPDRAGLYAQARLRHDARRRSRSASPRARGAAMPLDTMWRPLRDGATWPDGPVVVPGLPF